MYSTEFYVFQYADNQPIAGPFVDVYAACEFINAMEEPKNYCNYSRYALAKNRSYPRNKKGNALLQEGILYKDIAKLFEVALGQTRNWNYQPENIAAARKLLSDQNIYQPSN